MEFEIIPYKSVGPIKLGMRPAEVCQALNISRITVDYIEELGISANYNELNQCKSVFLQAPANPTFQRKDLLKGASFNKLHQWFKSIDTSTMLGDIDLVSFQFGIAVFTPSIESHGNKRPKSVMIFEEGYFDYIKTSALLKLQRSLRKLD
jgi:hypothetical protein